MKGWKSIAFALPFALLASCMVGPDYQTPKSKVAPHWTDVPAGSEKPLNAADAYWWRSFNDPVLNDLIEVAYQNNLSLQIAGVRILQARAHLNKSIGNLFPQQQGLAGAVNYAYLNPSAASLIPPGVTPNFTMDQILFSASWEIDFWGKYRRTIQSDRATFLGTVASYDNALVTLLADVASSYVSVRTAEELIRVAQTNLIAQQESYRVAAAQYEFGETSELDVRQAATLLHQTEAQIPPLENTLNQAKNALSVFLGEPPGQIDDRLKALGTSPVAPAEVAVGIPRDLLRRRPDVCAAGLTAASKSALIGVAKANMYPAFSLAGAFGFSANNEGKNSLSDMFMWQSRAAQAGASFVFPVFNYGRLINQVRVQDAEFQESILNYQNTVLTAQEEVQNGLSAFYTQQALTNLLAAAAAARRSTELSMLQYKAGEAIYTTVLTAEQSQLSVEDSVASAQGNVALGLIAIYRALGGGWEIREGHDVISDEVKAEMARRTDWGRMLEPENHLPKNSPMAQN